MSFEAKYLDYGSTPGKKQKQPFNLYTGQFGPEAWNYFNPGSGELQKRDIKTRNALYNADSFQDYWGKKFDTDGKPIELYYKHDFDKDGFEDKVAYNRKQNRVVGFNNQVITPEGKGKRAYQMLYMQNDKDFRKKNPYVEWLDSQHPVKGWVKPTKKYPEKGLKGMLYDIFKGFTSSTKIPSFVVVSMMNLIFKKLKDVIMPKEFTESKTEGEKKAAKVAWKLFKQTRRFNKILRDVITYLGDASNEQLVTLLHNAYNYLDKSDITTLDTSLTELMKDFEHKKMPKDEQDLKDEVEKHFKIKAINKLLKNNRITRADLYDQSEKTKTTIQSYGADLFNTAKANAEDKERKARPKFKRKVTDDDFAITGRNEREENEYEIEYDQGIYPAIWK